MTSVCLLLLLITGAACTSMEEFHRTSRDEDGLPLVMDVYDKKGQRIAQDAELGTKVTDVTSSSWLTPGEHSLVVESTTSVRMDDRRKVYQKTVIAGINAAGPSGLQHAEAPIVAAEIGAAQYFTGRDQNVPGGDRVSISASQQQQAEGGEGGSSFSTSAASQQQGQAQEAQGGQGGRGGNGGNVTLPPHSKGGGGHHPQPCKETHGKGGC